MTRRSWLVYGVLAAVWIALVGWQADEHLRVSKNLRDNLINLARTKSTTCGKLLAAGVFRGVIDRERLEAALNAIVNTNELRSVELLNKSEEVVASAGKPIELPPPSDFTSAVCWTGDTAIVKYPVDLGTNMVPELVIARAELRSMFTNSPERRGFNSTNRPPRPPDLNKERPYWMKEEDYQALINNKSAHSFVIAVSVEPVLAAQNDDFWMRVIIAFLGTAAVVGFAVGWRSLVTTSELQLRLVRASEQNLHLKEMNIAAAGLAHETRNPLNIIRGLAQLVCKQEDISPEIRAKTRDIINETDRVTAQLNEFINYSRPREVRRAATDLSAVAAEVAHALNYDIEEKKIRLEVLVESVVIEADEQLLRQALFNLVLNAVQAVPAQGIIRIRASRRNNEEAFIEISDNGPGVPADQRGEIFKPYFTTHSDGAGLGLAVVAQIVLAHGWEIECLANEPAGALFRISHVKLKMKE
ncbi:MAG: ATP-binding protein [Verrucomicrobiota bacterium]|jgi:signal transduction histidine kinase